MGEKLYTIQEVFEVLQANKITTNIESVRRWLRNGTIEGIAPTAKKKGWLVSEQAVQQFLAARLPDTHHTTHVVTNKDVMVIEALQQQLTDVKEQLIQSRKKEQQLQQALSSQTAQYEQLHEQFMAAQAHQLDEEAIRADQTKKEWYKYVKKGFISDTVEMKKTYVKDALAHLQLSGASATTLYETIWQRLEADNYGRGKQVKVAILDGYALFEGQRIPLADRYESLHERVLYPIIEYIRQ